MSVINREKEQKLTHEYIREILDYDEKTGNLIWKKHSWSTRIGKFAGTIQTSNYCHSNGKKYIRSEPQKKIVVVINNISYKIHRIIYFWYYGIWPEYIDHINGNSLDNRIENLRSVTSSENSMNRKISNRNTSGVVGVYFNKRDNIWFASGKINRKTFHIGCFVEKSDAISARKQWEKDNGFHENHGKRV